MKRCIILANGSPPKKSVVQFLRDKGYKTLICADGGANSALKLNLTPDFIIGDFDSIDKTTIEKFKNSAILKKIESQNDTDVEKSLKFASEENFDECVLLGVIGDRLDHSICNLSVALKFSDILKLRIIHENSTLEVIEGEVALNAKVGEVISLFGFDSGTTFTSEGLKYQLNGESLPFGIRESASNEAITEHVKIKIGDGKGFLIRELDKMEFNDIL